MFRNAIALLVAVLFASSSGAQGIPTSTFALLPGAPSSGDLAFITDGSGTTTVGDPAAGGGANRDLVAYDGSQTRWEFVQRLPATAPPTPPDIALDANQVGFVATVNGTAVENVRAALDAIGSPGSGGGGSLELVQTLPAQAEFHTLKATITDPAAVQFGTGVQLSALHSNIEPDHHIGWFYNKDGPGGTMQNQFEHSFHHRVETNFKNAGATNGDNQVEFNQDVFPPDNESNVTGQSAGFSATVDVGDTITFGSGATARVLAWADPLLEFRMDAGTSPASVDSIALEGESASLGATVTSLGSQAGHWWRPYIETWAVLAGTATFAWKTSATAPNGVFRIAREGAAVNAPTGFQVGTGLQAYTADRNWTSPAFVARGHTNGSDGTGDLVNYSPTGIRIDMDWRGTNWVWQNSAALLISTPTGPLGAGSSMQTPYAFRIMDQQAFDTSSSAPIVRLDAQTCGGVACSDGNAGNWTMAGGAYNNGHIVLGGIGAGGTHLWRDSTINQLKMRPDRPPFSASDGDALVTGSGVSTHGPAFWAISDGSAMDTGNEICGYTGSVVLAGVGLACQSTISFANFGTPASQDCTFQHGNAVTFIAMCR